MPIVQFEAGVISVASDVGVMSVQREGGGTFGTFLDTFIDGFVCVAANVADVPDVKLLECRPNSSKISYTSFGFSKNS